MSADDARVARTLADVRRARTAAGREALGGLCWIEGRRAHERALRAGAAVERALWAPPGGSPAAVERFEAVLAALGESGTELVPVAPEVLEVLTDGRTARGPVGLARCAPWRAVDSFARRGVTLVAVDVEDPGNVGALARTALAAGAAGMIVTGIADPWHPRAVRTSMGSVFKLPLGRAADGEAARDELAVAGVRMLAAVSSGGADPREAAAGGAVACFVGGEASGLDAALVEALDGRVTIPMPGGVDSFSVNAAAAILLYALGAQRQS